MLFNIPDEYRSRKIIDADEISNTLSTLVFMWDEYNEEEGDSPAYRALGVAIEVVQGCWTGRPVVSTAHLGGAKTSPSEDVEGAGQNSGA